MQFAEYTKFSLFPCVFCTSLGVYAQIKKEPGKPRLKIIAETNIIFAVFARFSQNRQVYFMKTYLYENQDFMQVYFTAYPHVLTVQLSGECNCCRRSFHSAGIAPKNALF